MLTDYILKEVHKREALSSDFCSQLYSFLNTLYPFVQAIPFKELQSSVEFPFKFYFTDIAAKAKTACKIQTIYAPDFMSYVDGEEVHLNVFTSHPFPKYIQNFITNTLAEPVSKILDDWYIVSFNTISSDSKTEQSLICVMKKDGSECICYQLDTDNYQVNNVQPIFLRTLCSNRLKGLFHVLSGAITSTTRYMSEYNNILKTQKD